MFDKVDMHFQDLKLTALRWPFLGLPAAVSAMVLSAETAKMQRIFFKIATKATNTRLKNETHS